MAVESRVKVRRTLIARMGPVGSCVNAVSKGRTDG